VRARTDDERFDRQRSVARQQRTRPFGSDFDVAHFALQNDPSVALELRGERFREPLRVRDETLLRQVKADFVSARELRHQRLDAGIVELVDDDAAVTPQLPCDRIAHVRGALLVCDYVSRLANEIAHARVLHERLVRIERLPEQRPERIRNLLDALRARR
jgi:hypothetical protein